MKDYRFILDRSSKKFICPDCNKRTFVKYIDTTIDEYLPDHYGRCDREIKCNYHLNPFKDGYSNFQKRDFKPKNSVSCFHTLKERKQETPKKPVYIPFEILKATRKGYKQNTFIKNLLHRVKFPFDAEVIEQVIKSYNLGTICKGERAGSVTFPFIDIKGNVRTIQAKQFDETNHTTSTDFLHSIYERDCKRNSKPLPDWLKRYLGNETKVSCLFGEHLLSSYQPNPIALVEAPKTAIVGTLYFGLPDNPKNFLWLAVYNLSSLNLEKCKVLQGRKVVLIPDLNAYEDWSNKAEQFQNEMPGTTFKVSDLLETLAGHEYKKEGCDLADFLINFDYKKFIEPDPQPERINVIEPLEPLPEAEEPLREYFPTWVKDIAELETYFTSLSLPSAPVRLNRAARIMNVLLFIESHLAAIKTNSGNRTFLPYLTRLHELKQILNEHFE